LLPLCPPDLGSINADWFNQLAAFGLVQDKYLFKSGFYFSRFEKDETETPHFPEMVHFSQH
jgi:hypothetical protein